MLCTLTGWNAEACDALFVQNAKAMAFDGARLTLKQADILHFRCEGRNTRYGIKKKQSG
jgi:hypothetical protein